MKIKKLLVQISVLLALMAVTFYIIFRDQSVSGIFDAVCNADFRYILAGMASMAIYIFLGGYCIKAIFKYKNQKMSAKRYLKYSFIEFFFSALTPSSTGGQPMQVVSMSKDGYRAADSTVVLIIIALLYRLTLILFTGLFFIFNYGFAVRYASYAKVIFIIGLITNILFALLLLLVLFSQKFVGKAGKCIVRLLCMIKIIKKSKLGLYYRKIDSYANQYHSSAIFMMTHKMLMIKSFLILSLQRMAILSVAYFVYHAMGLSELGYVEIIGIQLILSICVDIMPFPGSVGISETIFMYLYKSVFASKILPAILLCRGINFYAVFIISAIVVNATYIKKMLKHKTCDKISDMGVMEK